MYISSVNTWASRDSPLAELVRARLVYISVYNPKALGLGLSKAIQSFLFTVQLVTPVLGTGFIINT